MRRERNSEMDDDEDDMEESDTEENSTKHSIFSDGADAAEPKETGPKKRGRSLPPPLCMLTCTCRYWNP